MNKLVVGVVIVAMLGIAFTGCIWDGNQSPNAVIEVSPSGIINVGQKIYFSANQSKDPDGSIKNYSWDLGDGTIKQGQFIEHKYTSYGNKKVKLIVVDDKDSTGEASADVVVNAVPDVKVSLKPSPRLYSNYTGNFYYADEDIEFNAAETTDPDSTDLTFSWDFGDTSNTTSGQKVVSHKYKIGGNYTATLTVSDGYATKVWSVLIVIQDLMFNQTNWNTYTDVNQFKRFNFTAYIKNVGWENKATGTVMLKIESIGGTVIDSKNVTNTDEIAKRSLSLNPLEVNGLLLAPSGTTYVKITLTWNSVLMGELVIAVTP